MSTEQYQVALTQNHIGVTVKNNGNHLIVEGPQGYIDVWPSTGKWHDRHKGESGFGLNALITRALGSTPKPAELLHSIKLTHSTACWLKDVVHVPLHDTPFAIEPKEDSVARMEIWEALQAIQP